MLPTWYWIYVEKIELALKDYLKKYFSETWTPVIEEFKRIIFYWSTGWKRLRAILALEFYICFSKKTIEDITENDDIWKICIAIEIIHAFSLIHDDLPCMDNDELRRGQPTVWKKYGEYQAVLAGDMMNTLCFEILSNIQDAEKSKRIIKTISNAIWVYWMVGGQIEDMYYEKHQNELTKDILTWLHNKKTGKLIEASIIAWIILAGWENDSIKKYAQFWLHLWLAFQIKDDILDVEWTPEETGKSVWGEQKWFVYLLGIDQTKIELQELINQCKQDTEVLNSEKIDFIVEYVANRKK